MSSIDPDEAVAIVKELAESNKIIGDDLEPYAITCNQEMIDRILAAVKPKGPFPLDLGDYESAKINGDGNLDLCFGGDEIWTLTPEEMDCLWAAWGQHRGVDLGMLHDKVDLMMKELGRTRALQSILDNAEASE